MTLDELFLKRTSAARKLQMISIMKGSHHMPSIN